VIWWAARQVFIAHLTGKKHIKALKAAGQVGEAQAIQRKLEHEKNLERSKQALEKAVAAKEAEDPETHKRKAEAEAAEAAEQSKKLKSSVELQDAKVDLSDKDAMQLQMAYASGQAKKMVNVAVNPEWWKGTAHSNKAEEPDYSELANGVEAGAANRNTQKQVIEPASSPAPWCKPRPSVSAPPRARAHR
jgi:hypothetical protein